MHHSRHISLFIALPLLASLLTGCPPNRGGGSGAAPRGPALAGRILYQHESAGTGLDIFLLDAGGASESALVATPEHDEWPTLGPVPTDGSPHMIAFASKQNGISDIFTFPLAGGTGVMPQNRTNDPTISTDDAFEDTTPDWSSDNRIAFATKRDGDFDIWMMSGNGANKRPVWQGAQFDNNCVDTEPTWSPDNSKIAYTSNCGGNGFAIWVGSTDPQNPSTNNIAAIGNRDVVDPSWSPDGTQLVAESCSQSNREDCEIVIMNADGSSLRNLTNTPNIGEVDPVFSADGQTIIMGYFPAGGTGIQIARMPAAGGAATVISPQGSHGRGPVHVP